VIGWQRKHKHDQDKLVSERACRPQPRNRCADELCADKKKGVPATTAEAELMVQRWRHRRGYAHGRDSTSDEDARNDDEVRLCV